DLPDGVPVWLYVGRLITYKGLPIILDALKMLADKGKDFRMVFVGKGPDRELLESRARELGLTRTARTPSLPMEPERVLPHFMERLVPMPLPTRTPARCLSAILI
ncbi:MAG: glycosyltransferase, partial [Planctomycetaceae bacterium]|nr:glycosyltransferase [Planctomycetaceae bacterium]